MVSFQPMQPTQSDMYVQQLAMTNPQLYNMAFGQSNLFSGGAGSLMSNPAYSGISPAKQNELLMQAESLFMSGLPNSPLAQQLHAQSQQGLMMQQMQQQQQMMMGGMGGMMGGMGGMPQMGAGFGMPQMGGMGGMPQMGAGFGMPQMGGMMGMPQMGAPAQQGNPAMMILQQMMGMLTQLMQMMQGIR